MKTKFKTIRVRPAPPAYHRAFECLNAALEQNTPCENSEKIRLMRRAYFADVDELERSGKVKLPE